MSCFYCLFPHERAHHSPRRWLPLCSPHREKIKKIEIEARNSNIDGGNKNIAAQTFSFRELAAATNNFRQESLLGEGGFGPVYKGRLEKTGQIVAVKQLDRNGLQGNREFLVEVLMLSLLHHENLVNLIGYCADGDQRLLVYEFMALGSLEDHLLDIPPNQPPLDWSKRIKIALDAAKGLEYLHIKAKPPVIYRDLKSSNILIDEQYNAKLSDFGLAKLGPVGDKSHVSSRVMGTYGYCAPEYQRTGQLTVKSDVYSFGIVLLELITGKRAIMSSDYSADQLLINWAYPIIKDPSRHTELADPLLKGNIQKKGLTQAIAVAEMCIHEDPSLRPMISDVVTALSYIRVEPETDSGPGQSPVKSPTLPVKPELPEISPEERKRVVAEAIEWGSKSRNENPTMMTQSNSEN